jgi:hypothetical protein
MVRAQASCPMATRPTKSLETERRILATDYCAGGEVGEARGQEVTIQLCCRELKL